jgi:hypothetical protein
MALQYNRTNHARYITGCHHKSLITIGRSPIGGYSLTLNHMGWYSVKESTKMTIPALIAVKKLEHQEVQLIYCGNG